MNDELFIGKDNLDYLDNLMANNKDKLEYYYRYTDRIMVTPFGSDKPLFPIAKEIIELTDNPNTKGLTGRVKYTHYQYYGYKIIDNNVIKSPLVDDIKDIIDEYPYFCKDCFEIITKEYNFDKDKVSSIKIEDIKKLEEKEKYLL